MPQIFPTKLYSLIFFQVKYNEIKNQQRADWWNNNNKNTKKNGKQLPNFKIKFQIVSAITGGCWLKKNSKWATLVTFLWRLGQGEKIYVDVLYNNNNDNKSKKLFPIIKLRYKLTTAITTICYKLLK